MSQDIWNYLFILASFAVYITIAIRSRVNSTKEFYVAGGGVSPFFNGMATAADWMSAATFISMAGGIAAMGYDGSVFLMGWTGGFVLLTVLMVPFLRKFGKFTVPDFIGDRYYSNLARVVAIICAIFICLTYIFGQMRGVGIVFSNLFHISTTAGVLLGAVIVFFYASLGGMKGITYTQVAQYCVMVFAYTIPAIFISILVTGHVIPQLGIGSFVEPGVSFLDKLDNIQTELGFNKYTEGSKSMIDVFAITAALMFGTAGLPHVIVRFFTVSNVKATRTTAIYTLSFIAIIYLTAPTVAAFAKTNLINTVYSSEEKVDKSYTSTPQWFKNYEDKGQIAWVDKNNDGLIQFRPGKVFADGKPNFSQERGEHNQRLTQNEVSQNKNELYYEKDIIVMANPEIAGLPQWVIALVMAGCIAAALSTAAGLLLVLSTAISHDLMKKVIKPDLSDREELRWARIASFISLAIAAYFGINPPSDLVAKTVAFAFGLAASSFFPTIVMGIFSTRINKQGGIAGMIAGITFTACYIIYFNMIADPGMNTSENWLFGISSEGIGIIGMLLNFLVAGLVSHLTPPPPKEVVEMVENIRLPNNAGDATH